MAKRPVVKFTANFERNLEEIERFLTEDVLKEYLLLHALIDGAIYLLAIRHQQQLSFDFEGHWGR